MKEIILMLTILGLILIPTVANAQEPTCYPPEEWRVEYNEWFAWQYDLQQQYTSETSRGLGAFLDFIQWAEMRAMNEPYWWKPIPIPVPTIRWQGYSYLFCDSNGERRAASWSRLI